MKLLTHQSHHHASLPRSLLLACLLLVWFYSSNSSQQPSSSVLGSSTGQRPVWKHVDSANIESKLDFPDWGGFLPDSTEIKTPLEYFHYFFSDELMEFTVVQNNLDAIQNNPNKSLCLTQNELSNF